MTIPATYALPFIAGKIYNIWWLTGLDFDHLTMFSSYTLTENDPAITFKFNYTLSRELYDIGAIVPWQQLALFTPQGSVTDPNTCVDG